MSPTIFRYKGCRFFFYSREEKHKHIHIVGKDGESKFWMSLILNCPIIYDLVKIKLQHSQKLLNTVEKKSSRLATSSSEIEVTGISLQGIKILVFNKEYFLPFTSFPWFQQAKIDDILNVEFNRQNLYWPSLDIDLSIDIIEHPDKYPSISNS